MKTQGTISDSQQLRHNQPHRVALVALGNSLRADDGVCGQLLAMLPAGLRDQVCLLDAGCYARDIPAFVAGHRTGIVIDAISAANTSEMVIVDLGDVATIEPDCTHALSWLDELLLAKTKVELPSRLLFVGIPVCDVGWRIGLSDEIKERLPELVLRLQQIIEMELAACTKQP